MPHESDVKSLRPEKPRYGSIQLRFESWPIQDQQAWTRSFIEPLENNGTPSFYGLAEKTLTERENSYGKFLNFLLKAGKLNDDQKPHERVTAENVIAYIDNLRLRQSASSVNEEMNRLRGIMKVFAPGQYWCWIKRLPNSPRGPEIRASMGRRNLTENIVTKDVPNEKLQSVRTIKQQFLSLPSSDWPSVDRHAWERAKRSDGLFDEGARLAHLAPASISTLESSYGIFLNYLMSQNILDPTVPGVERATAETLMNFIESLRLRRRASTVRCELANLSTAFRVFRPDSDWRWICRLPNAPNRAEGEASRKTVLPPDPAHVLQKGLGQFDRATSAAPSSRNDVSARNGLMVAFSTLFALRLKNLCDLEIGKHLLGDHQGMQVTIYDSMKNGSAVIFDVPGWLMPRLQIYLNEARPRILGNQPDHGFLWMSSRDGLKLSRSEVVHLFPRFGKRQLGRSVNTHLARHMMANELIIRDPGDAELIAAALGHTSLQMVQEVYTRSATVELSKAWQKTINKRRRNLGLD
jgi:integrase